ncbi:MAG TPA: hypothetical protein VGA04_16015 [Streptosporangiaceae bacterium]
MMLIKADHGPASECLVIGAQSSGAPVLEYKAPPVPVPAPMLEQTVRVWHEGGASQRAIARELNIDRPRVKPIIEQPA